MIKQRSNLLTFIMAVGVFSILNTEMGIAGVVPLVAERFAIAVPQAALLVSGFALVVALAGPTMPLLFSRVNRKAVMLLSLGVFTACNAAAVFATSFEALLVLRVIPAAFHPLYVSMALAVAAQMGDAAQAVKASARVFVGVSAGMVVGAPVASLLGGMFSLSAAMAFFAAVTAAVFVATLLLVPSMPVAAPLSYQGQLSVLKKPVLWVSLLCVVALNGAMFGFYGYLADYLGAVASMDTAGVSAAMLVFGLTNMAGNVAAGRLLAAHAARTVAVVPFALMAAYGLLFACGGLTLASAAAVTLLGFAVGVGNNAGQYLVSTAGSEAPDFTNGLFLTAANLGITVGTPLCGMFMDSMGTIFGIAGSLILLAAAAALIAVRRRLTHAGAARLSCESTATAQA